MTCTLNSTSNPLQGMLNLPPKVIEMIAPYLNTHEIATCMRVSKEWKTIFLPSLWSKVNMADFCFKLCTLPGQHKKIFQRIKFRASPAQNGVFIRELSLMSMSTLALLAQAGHCTNLYSLKYHNRLHLLHSSGLSTAQPEFEEWRTQNQIMPHSNAQSTLLSMLHLNPALVSVDLLIEDATMLPVLTTTAFDGLHHLRDLKLYGQLVLHEEATYSGISATRIVRDILRQHPRLKRLTKALTGTRRQGLPQDEFDEDSNDAAAKEADAIDIQEIDLSGLVPTDQFDLDVMVHPPLCPQLTKIHFPPPEAQGYIPAPSFKCFNERCPQVQSLVLTAQHFLELGNLLAICHVVPEVREYTFNTCFIPPEVFAEIYSRVASVDSIWLGDLESGRPPHHLEMMEAFDTLAMGMNAGTLTVQEDRLLWVANSLQQ